MNKSSLFRRLFVIAIAGITASGFAQTVPAKTVKIVIPWSAGGGTDLLGRSLGQKLSAAWNQPVLIENRPGASGNIGADFVAKSPADGGTLLFTGMSQVTTYSMFQGLPFDPQKDLTPISVVAEYPHVIVVNSNFPAKNVAELVAMAKAQPGKLTYASAGSGTQYHLAAELFKDAAAVDIQHIPFKGGAPAVTAVLGGHVDMAFANLVQVMQQVKAGKLKALAITSAKRLSTAPDIPTVAESGLPNYEFLAYAVMYGPAHLSGDIAKKLSADIAKHSASIEIRDRLAADGGQVIGNTPEQFKAIQKVETEKWTKLIKKVGLKVE